MAADSGNLHCQYGFGWCCSVATEVRLQPTGEQRLCEFHAHTLDRIRASVATHADLLERLRSGGD